MRVPMSWLREFVDVPVTPEELARRVTLAGLEVESLHRIGETWEPDKVVVAQITAVAPHPNADRLRLVTVDLGRETKTVVTGAPNVRAGQKVIFGGLGTRYIDNHDPERKLATLKRSTIRGVPSEGMVMSEAELGLSDEHEGIIELPDDAPVGQPARDYLGDAVLEFEITPNLVHDFSVIGVAREVAALYDRPPRLPEPRPAGWSAPDPALVTIEAPDLCGRYVGAVIRGVRVGPSPRWLQHRLGLIGVRPINNIVDITNYVMFEYGQPLHAFDLRQVRGGRIIVRRAAPGEVLETLDHVRRELDARTLVIADAERAVALAGIIGGVDSEIGADTEDVLLESANFTMQSIRRTRRGQKLRTEASSRFERGIDPELALPAARRAAELILDCCPGATIERVGDAYPNPPVPVVVEFPLAEIERLLGVAHAPATVDAVLTRLGFGVEAVPGAPDRRHVRVPSWRSDVRIPADLVEEVARVVGYDTLPDTLPRGQTPAVVRDPRLLFEEAVRDTLVACGLQEIITYSWTNADDLARLDGGERWAADVPVDRPWVEILNPLRPDGHLMRPSLLPALLRTLAESLKHREGVRVFEVASVYLPTTPNSLPHERRTLSLGLAGQRAPRSHHGAAERIDFFDLKGVIEALLGRLGVAAEMRPGGPRTLHPGRAAEVVVGGRVVGIMGELHPGLTDAWELADQAVALAEFDLDALRAAMAAAVRYQPFSRYQPVVQDLAVIVDEATPASQVGAVVTAAAPHFVQRVRLFDVYRGAPIPAGKKSLAVEVTLQARDRDLPEHEIERARGRIEQRLRQELGASLRTT
jgi:phenylalanyl-tRNA synthetase beta chain